MLVTYICIYICYIGGFISTVYVCSAGLFVGTWAAGFTYTIVISEALPSHGDSVTCHVSIQMAKEESISASAPSFQMVWKVSNEILSICSSTKITRCSLVRKERLSRGVLSETEFLHLCREFEDFPHCQPGENSLPTMESRQNSRCFQKDADLAVLAHRLPEVCGAKWCWKVAQGQSANRAEDGQIRLVGIGFFAVWERFGKVETAHSQICLRLETIGKKNPNFHGGSSVSLLTIN